MLAARLATSSSVKAHSPVVTNSNSIEPTRCFLSRKDCPAKKTALSVLATSNLPSAPTLKLEAAVHRSGNLKRTVAPELADSFSFESGNRSEERRVGKECRCGWWREQCKKKEWYGDREHSIELTNCMTH